MDANRDEPEERTCRFPLDGLLLSPQGDYIVRTKFIDSFSEKVEAGKKILRKHTKEKANAKKGTCLEKLVDFFVEGTGFDGDEGSRLPYRHVYNAEGMGKWSKSTVRNNIKKLERLGVVRIYKPNDKETDLYRKLNKIIEGGEGNLDFRKIVISNLNLDSNELGIVDEDFDTFDSNKIIRCVSAKDIEDLRKEGKIIEEYDMRGMSKQERTNIRQSLYSNMKREVYANREEIMPRDKKLEAVDEALKKMEGMPYIKDVYLAGSFARDNDVTGSDVDLVLVRDSCPGMDACYKKLKKRPLDLFCFTYEEMADLKEKGAVLLSTLKKLK